MRKFLMTTTALVSIGFAGTSLAASWETSVGGYMNIGGAFSKVRKDVDLDSATPGVQADKDSFHVIRDGEIHFKGKLTLDNGLTFGARVELEAFGTSDQIDENYATLGGSFGTLMIGSNDTASYNVGTAGIGDVTGVVGYYDGTVSFVGDNTLEPADQYDSPTIFYTSPSIHGFTVGASYAPDAEVDGGTYTAYRGDAATTYRKIGTGVLSFGAGYEKEFGKFSVALGAGYTRLYHDFPAGSASSSRKARDIWHLGASVGYADFKAHAYFEDKGEAPSYDTVTSTVTTQDLGYDIALGADYTKGAWAFGGGYAWNNKSKEGHGTLGTAYTLAPGAKVIGVLEYGKEKKASDPSTTESAMAGAVFFNLAF